MITMTPNEVKKLIDSLKINSLRDKALLDLMLHSGLRISEALNLRTEDINGNLITVRRGKGGKRRVVALTRSYGFLEAWLRQCDGEFIFTTRNGKRLAASHVRRLLGKFGTHPHAFRHAHAAAVYEQTADLAAVQRQLGHSRISTTAIYLQGLGADLDKVAALTF